MILRALVLSFKMAHFTRKTFDVSQFHCVTMGVREGFF